MYISQFIRFARAAFSDFSCLYKVLILSYLTRAIIFINIVGRFQDVEIDCIGS